MFFTSADMGYPQTLTAAGMSGPTVLFARNHLCAILRPGLSVTPQTLLTTLLRTDVKLGTSSPDNDPGGAYAWAMFKKADGLKAGASATLEAKTIKTGNQPGMLSAPPNTNNALLWFFQEKKLDAFISYCTSGHAAAEQLSRISTVELPQELAVSADYGLTVLKRATPQAMQFAFSFSRLPARKSWRIMDSTRRYCRDWSGAGAFLWCFAAHADQPVPIPAPTATVAAFTRLGNFCWVAEHIFLLAIPLMFLFSGWSAGLRARCSRLARQNWFLTIASFAASYVLLTGLLLLPVSYLRFSSFSAYLPQAQRHTASQWFIEQLGTTLVEAIAAALFCWIPYWLLSRSPRRWWLWTSALLSPIVLFVLILQPFWISPLTSRFTPLTDAALLAQITQLAKRCDVENAEVFVGGDNYQVAGLGPTKRILIGTRYAEEFSPPQLRFLIAHELGHNVNGDNWKAWGAISLGLLAVFGLTRVLGNAAIGRWQSRFRFVSLSDPASLPLMVFFLFAFLTLLTPLNMLWSRNVEHEADRFGLELTHENRAAALMFAGFEQTYLESPDPGWFALATRWNHPPSSERIRFANDYHPWLDGKPLEFAAECKMP